MFEWSFYFLMLPETNNESWIPCFQGGGGCFRIGNLVLPRYCLIGLLYLITDHLFGCLFLDQRRKCFGRNKDVGMKAGCYPGTAVGMTDGPCYLLDCDTDSLVAIPHIFHLLPYYLVLFIGPFSNHFVFSWMYWENVRVYENSIIRRLLSCFHWCCCLLLP